MGDKASLAQHPSILHLSPLFLSLARNGAGEKPLPLKQGGREKRGKGEEVRRRRRRQGQRISRLPFRGTWSPGHALGVRQGEWSNQFSDKAIYYRKAAGFSVLCHQGGRRAGGEWQELDAVEAAWPGEVPLQSDAGVVGLGCSGALASKTSGVTALTPGFTF